MHSFFQGLGGILLLGMVAGCDVQIPTLVRKQDPVVPTPKPQPVATTPKPKPQPQTVKVTVTVATPADIKVKVGDSVLKSQLLVDSIATRQRLVRQRLTLQQKLQQLSLVDIPALAAPNAEFLKQQVQEAQNQVQVAREQIQASAAALAEFRQESAYTPEAWDLLAKPEERQALQARQTDLENAKQSLGVAQSKLAVAQKQLKAAQAAPRPQNDAKTRANLQRQLAQLEEKLKSLKTVLSPATGVVKAIKPQGSGQASNNLNFELSILVTDALSPTPDRSGSASPLTGLPSSSPLPSPRPSVSPLPPLPSFSPDEIPVLDDN